MTSVPLVVGGSALLGSHLLELRPEAAGTFRRVPRPGLIPLDLAGASACRSLLERLHPSPVVIAQNPPSLDWCESHESSSLREQVTDLALFLDLLRRNLPAARVVYLSM